MEITGEKLTNKLYEIAQANAPVREIVDKKGRPLPRAVGKRGTNMYSPYPGNLKNNGIYRDGCIYKGVCHILNVSYLFYYKHKF